jgi:outer membrane protein assembly factor BamB
MSAANGDEAVLPIKFLPPNAKASSLNMADNVVYTTTNQGCGAAPNAVWALDLKGDEPKVSSFPSNGGGFWGLGGVVLGSDNTVYAQASDRLFVLTPGDVKRKTHFLLSGPSIDQNAGMNAASPVVFKLKDHEMVAATGKDGHIYLLDAGSLGILSRTSQIADTNSPERGVWGSLASWEDPSGVRWLLAPVWGPVGADFKSLVGNGAVTNGAVVAFKVQELEGKPVLAPAWVSRDMSSPEPPVVVNGVVFALSAGDYTRHVNEAWGVHSVEERPKGSTHATLYALDAATGKELYSSGSNVTAPAALTGITVANGRAYFGTVDSTFYTFGLYMEH